MFATTGLYRHANRGVKIIRNIIVKNELFFKKRNAQERCVLVSVQLIGKHRPCAMQCGDDLILVLFSV